jgi:hypothetical protein
VGEISDKALFENAKMHAHAKKVNDAIDSVIGEMENPAVPDVIRDLGARHWAYGTREAHFPVRFINIPRFSQVIVEHVVLCRRLERLWLSLLFVLSPKIERLVKAPSATLMIFNLDGEQRR